jgi:hypothetical protein
MPARKSQFLVRELGTDTWPDFARIMEKHNGVWGACWCVAFHPKSDETKERAASNRAYKSSFLFGGTESMFAEAGFSPVGALGTTKVVMRRRVHSR